MSEDPYNRMQDITVAYATMVIKILTTLTAGSLIALGAAFIDLALLNDVDPKITGPALKATMFSFKCFSLCLILILFGIVTINFSRAAYQKGTEINRDRKKRDNDEKLGSALEFLGSGLILTALFIFCFSLIQLVASLETIVEIRTG